MDIQELYNLIESHLENGIECESERKGKMKRVKLPVPEEFGGGTVTGLGYLNAVNNLIDLVREKITDEIKNKTNSPLFNECWEKWIFIKQGQDRSPSTISSYKRIAANHILPFFEGKRVNEITPDDIQLYYNSIMNLSKSTSTQSKAILCGIFDRAARMGYIDRNPMLYKYDRSTKQGQKVVLQDSDLIKVIQCLDYLIGKDYLYSCFLCFTALRRGEILGLRWEDIDFDKHEMNIRNNVTFPDGSNEPVILKPKDDSIGIVHLQSGLEERLKPFRKKSGYLIPYSDLESNKPITKSMFTKMWRRINKMIDLKGATSHSFRATYVTMMNAHCDHVDPKALQGALRHKTPDLAIKVYTKENKEKTKTAEQEYDDWLKEQLAK